MLILLAMISPVIGHAQTGSSSIVSGTAWLLSARYGIGFWALTTPPDPLQTEFTEDDFSPTYLRDSLEALKAIQTVEVPLTEYELTLNWVKNLNLSPLEQLSSKIQILSAGGSDIASALLLLSAYRNSDGGFGGLKSYPSSILDTAYSLQGLATAHSTETTTITGAVSYLLIAQNPDGGWGFVLGQTSHVYYTAIVMQALESALGGQAQTTAIANALNKGSAYLIAHQNADGGIGNSPSTVPDTALALMALARTTSDATARASATQYVLSQQLGDGSWNDDPYATALALQALYLVSNLPTPVSSSNGQFKGLVVDNAAGIPIAGALVALHSAGGPTLVLSNWIWP